MRLSNIINTSLFVALSAGSVFADHNFPQGSVAALDAEARELNSEVYYAPLSYNVKNSVGRFVNDVRNLDRCVDNCDSDGVTDDHTAVGVPYQCRSYLQRARSSFYPVERYLYDTNYDLPRVYAAYQNARSALYSLGGADDSVSKDTDNKISE